MEERKRRNGPRGHISKYIVSGVLVLALSAAGGVGGAYWYTHSQAGTVVTTTTATATPTSTSSAKDASSIASKMSQSVVAITTEEMTTSNFWYGSQVSSGAGSGVIMSSDGYIITNAHVVSGASKIKVTTSNNKTYTAKLVGSYTKGDIAVLKIEATGLKAATFADSSKIKQGQVTYAVGNPEGTFANSITSGIVSAVSRKITISLSDDDSSSSDSDDNSWFSQYTSGRSQSSTTTLNVIQTDAAVSPGNSGGGLFNANGDLIGIVNAKSSDSDSEGLGFAIPANTAVKIAKQLITNGKVSS
ncbi:S1C family serine protease [Intestinibaculum porci]|uniref:Protease n=1 Tax=Intestinibaculum porci TaxID=2487118 RepID=A0A3G9J5J1_9FIRM|nr:trypsin-like peptidase domain-containing protein [Intestinibaculum porci]MDD6350610.1 trypsin-like peptidase domain-containing protein [Intestinibaculum porci]BBH26447.1 protease [Intestinibaculum porci]HAN58054.1 serine protease [Erysipelotrichaceae bacterium]